MEKDYTLGRMVENMMVNINLIKNMDTVSTFGQIKDNIKVFGNLESNFSLQLILKLILIHR